MRDKGEDFFIIFEGNQPEKEFSISEEADTELFRPNLQKEKAKIQAVVLRKKILISEDISVTSERLK